jgi:hypothetical protein
VEAPEKNASMTKNNFLVEITGQKPKRIFGLVVKLHRTIGAIFSFFVSNLAKLYPLNIPPKLDEINIIEGFTLAIKLKG